MRKTALLLVVAEPAKVTPLTLSDSTGVICEAHVEVIVFRGQLEKFPILIAGADAGSWHSAASTWLPKLTRPSVPTGALIFTGTLPVPLPATTPLIPIIPLSGNSGLPVTAPSTRIWLRRLAPFIVPVEVMQRATAPVASAGPPHWVVPAGVTV